ncbi:MAG TPA: TonB-dependent receptor [Steroidobacteraceae bacterium]|nr:TonB-dependent receptor [Steroidobacteraceae bacterium]
MERKNQVASAVRRALVMGALTAAGVTPALAQENLGEIVVTGSRIRSANLESTTPVTQVTAADVVTQGVTRIEDLVNQLPQAFAAQNVTVANGATGTATLNLRGLGSPRTLVLVDGRRMPYGGVTNSAADINQIPTQMIERVDVLTGGASAVYGSDAVAGVVNFIMKKDFEGVQVTSQYNFYWHENDFKGPGEVKLRDVIAQRAEGNPSQFALPDDSVTDGEGKELSLLVGVNSGDGRGNITAYATVFDSDQVLQRDRDYSACSLNPAPVGGSFSCGGSSTSAPGRFITFGNGAENWAATDDPEQMRPFDFTNDLYNFGPLNHYQRPERRYNIGALGHYEFNEHADVYTQLMFNQYESIAQIAPGGSFGETSTINCGNPLIPASLVQPLGCVGADPEDDTALLILRRNIEGGGRQQSFDNSSFRIVAGVRGAINEAWGYDASAQYSQGTGTQSTLNNFQKDRVAKALHVLDVDGVPTCMSVIDGSDPNCVPYNPFVLGGITPEQLAYLQVTGVQVGRITQEIYNGVITGDLGVYGVKSPLAADGIQLVFGTEYRRDSLTNTVDALQEAFQLTGSGGPTIGIDGATKVNELFMEARVPLAQDQAFAESLSLDTAYRYSDYGNSIQTDTYKFGMEWAPVSDVRLRASYQRAVRAANIVELFTAQGFNLFDAPGDPCGAQARDPTASDADCIATGVPANLVGDPLLDSPAGQYSFLQGGNPALTPEESDTYSYGIVLQPRWVPGLAITVDYFDINIEDTISTFGPNNTLTACYAGNDLAACDRINRDPSTGALWLGNGHVENTNINIGSLSTTGYDVNIGYTGLEMGRFGSLAFNLTGTYVINLITQPAPGLDIDPHAKVRDWYDCVGFYSSECGIPTPQWRHRFRTSWQTPWDLDLSFTWRHYGAVTGLDAPNLAMAEGQLDHTLPAEDYFDLAANWAITEKANVTLGVNNVLDDNPSISGAVGTTGNGNTYPQTYDALGRYVFLRATVDF